MAAFQTIINYFNQLAVQYLEQTETEKHFFRAHEEYVNFPALSLESYRGSLTNNDGDGFFTHRDLMFIVMDHNHDTDDDSKIDTIFDEMEDLGLKLINQIYKDGKDRVNPVQFDFDTNSVSWNQIENKKDHNYGWEFTVNFLNVHIVENS